MGSGKFFGENGRPMLANTIEPSVCGGDAVLCQITLTTCFCFDADNQCLTQTDGRRIQPLVDHRVVKLPVIYVGGKLPVTYR